MVYFSKMYLGAILMTHTVDRIMELADRYAFHIPGSTYSDEARSALLAALQEVVAPQEPVSWEWRVLDTHPQTVTSGQWSEWERVVPRNQNTDTVQDRLAEFQEYIKQGYKYELRALYAAPQPSAVPIVEQMLEALAATNDIRPSTAEECMDKRDAALAAGQQWLKENGNAKA
jgi:hypothetical protein